MVGQSGDGGQRLVRKGRGQSRLEKSSDGSQSPPRAEDVRTYNIFRLQLRTTAVNARQLLHGATELLFHLAAHYLL